MTAVPTDPLEGLKLVMASPPVDCRVMLVMFAKKSYEYWMTLLAANEAVANTIPAREGENYTDCCCDMGVPEASTGQKFAGKQSESTIGCVFTARCLESASRCHADISCW